ncbi:MAG: hypothetical protein J5I81_07770 [Nitrococcus mobilis]|nr:hypothetical protein [Nitrococcus mobilis]
MREIVAGIHMWSRLAQPQNYNFNGHLVMYPGGNLVIDPVEPEGEELERLVAAGVAHIVLTNRNHSRAANQVRERTGATVLIHPADAGHARQQGTQIDGELAVDQTIGPFQVLDASGKSPGEVALFWPERRLLLVGDAIISDPPGKCRLLPEVKLDDPAALRASVKRLCETVDFDRLLVGDGEPILTDAKARVRELVASFS